MGECLMVAERGQGSDVWLGRGWHLCLTLFSGPGTVEDTSRKHLGLLHAGPTGVGGTWHQAILGKGKLGQRFD